MSEDERQPDADDDPIPLSYAGPSLRRRWAGVSPWRVICRIVGGMLAAMLCFGYVVNFLSMAGEIRLLIIAIAGVAALVGMIWWGRSLTVWQPEWETGKDRRAATWRHSTSRYDSSGVRIVDPHSQGKLPEE